MGYYHLQSAACGRVRGPKWVLLCSDVLMWHRSLGAKNGCGRGDGESCRASQPGMFRRLRIGDSWLCTRAGRAGRRSIPRQQLPIERDVTSDDRPQTEFLRNQLLNTTSHCSRRLPVTKQVDDAGR